MTISTVRAPTRTGLAVRRCMRVSLIVCSRTQQVVEDVGAGAESALSRAEAALLAQVGCRAGRAGCSVRLGGRLGRLGRAGGTGLAGLAGGADRPGGAGDDSGSEAGRVAVVGEVVGDRGAAGARIAQRLIDDPLSCRGAGHLDAG